MMLLRAIDIEVFEADDLAVRFRQDLTHIAVKGQLAECVRIQGILAFIALAEAMLAAAIGRG